MDCAFFDVMAKDEVQSCIWSTLHISPLKDTIRSQWNISNLRFQLWIEQPVDLNAAAHLLQEQHQASSNRWVPVSKYGWLMHDKSWPEIAAVLQNVCFKFLPRISCTNKAISISPQRKTLVITYFAEVISPIHQRAPCLHFSNYCQREVFLYSIFSPEASS